jgi:hypothetical protein
MNCLPVHSDGSHCWKRISWTTLNHDRKQRPRVPLRLDFSSLETIHSTSLYLPYLAHQPTGHPCFHVHVLLSSVKVRIHRTVTFSVLIEKGIV